MKIFFRKAKLMKCILNTWPPFLFTGIHVVNLSSDFKQATVKLTQRPWNTNAVGVHFGGSLFAMTDPFYMLMITANLGRDYIVWDTSADIDFIKPGKGKVFAEFVINDDIISDIVTNTASGEKYTPVFKVRIYNELNETVAELNRTVYIRKKKPKHL